jgi:hypothetical protein
MSISFKLNFQGKIKNYNYNRNEILENAFKSILKDLNLYETTDPTVYSFTFGTRILNKKNHVNKKLGEVIRDNVTIKLMTKKDMGYS